MPAIGRSPVYDFLDRIIAQLGGKRLPDGSWMVHCPAHDDQEPSLHVTPSGDRLLFHCFAGCSWEAVKSALQRLGLFDESYRIAKAVYVYYDENGNPLFRKIRFEPKDFVIERRVGNTWRVGLGDTRRVIYNLPEVLKSDEVWIVEGEKDVETLRKFGVVATTNPNGASEHIIPQYVEPLRGKNVIIIPDQDDAGLRHAADWVNSLKFVVSDLKVVNLPPPYKDVSDFLLTRPFEELKHLVAKAPSIIASQLPSIARRVEYGAIEYPVEQAKVSLLIWPFSSGSDKFVCEFTVSRGEIDLWGGREDFASFRRRSDLAQALENRFPSGMWHIIVEDAYVQLKSMLASSDEANEPEVLGGYSWMVKPFILEGGPNLLYGPMGNLKSLLAQALALSVAMGKALIPSIELYRNGPVLWLDFENMGQHLLRLRTLRLAGQDVPQFRVICCGRPIRELIVQLGRFCKKFRPVLIIIDSLGPAAGGDLGVPSQAFRFYEIIKAFSVPVLIIAHPPKNNPVTVFGSTFFANLARNIWSVERVEERNPDIGISLFHEKCTSGFLEAPIGYWVRFLDEEGKIIFRPWLDPITTRAFRVGSTNQRVIDFLKAAGGSATKQEISEACGISLSALRVVLTRLKREGKVYEDKKLKEIVLNPNPRKFKEPEEPEVEESSHEEEEIPF